MRFIHFTEAATDPLMGFCAHGVRCVLLADGAGEAETYVSCLHFEPGGWISNAPAVRDSVLLLVHGEATFELISAHSEMPGVRHHITPGVGLVTSADDRYRLDSDAGAIVFVVEAERLEATECGISTPERIWGARWPGESDAPLPWTPLRVMRWLYFRLFWARVFGRSLLRRKPRPDSSGWGSEPSGRKLVWRLMLGRGRKRVPR